MKINEELELKLLLDKSDFDNLLSFFPNAKFETQVNYYYSSNQSNRYTFRLREKNNKVLFTLKEHQGDKLMEYEKYVEGKLEDDKEIMEQLASRNEFPPFELLGTLTTHRALIDTGKAELCFDINDYNGIRDYEIEYEVTKEHDHINEFKKILAKANISYESNTLSKYKRFVQSLNK